MARWSDGYVTDISYTTGFYRELTPIWLWLTALLGGQRPPDLSRPFRFAELGCGNGLTTNCVAASNPHAEVWGFDFNPAHIDNCVRLAREAGLGNAHFREAGFANIAHDDSLPMFDFIVVHGVYTWIAPETQRDLLTFIDRHLAPGGLVYLSYNTPTGWDAMAPLQHLMRLLARGMNGRSDQVMPAVLDQLDRMIEANAAFFRRNPEMAARVRRLRQADARYVAHEYLNQHWRPAMFAEVADAMSAIKCEFVASATVADNFDYASVPGSVLPLLGDARDRQLKETLRDFGNAQSFRRDVFRRGLAPLTLAEQSVVLQELRIVPILPRPDGDFRFNTSQGEMMGNRDIYAPLLDRFYEAGGITISDARGLGADAPRTIAQAAESLTLMVHAGLAHPTAPAAVAEQALASTAAFNRAISRLNRAGGEFSVLTSPVIGSAIGADLLETFCREDLAGTETPSADSLGQAMAAGLRAAERNLLKDGQVVTDPAVETATLQETAARLTAGQWPLRRALRIYD